MVEEGSISLRPWGFTLYYSFIINLPHLGFGELGTLPQTGALFYSCLLQLANMGRPSLTAGIKEKKEEGNIEIPQYIMLQKSSKPLWKKNETLKFLTDFKIVVESQYYLLTVKLLCKIVNILKQTKKKKRKKN